MHRAVATVRSSVRIETFSTCHAAATLYTWRLVRGDDEPRTQGRSISSGAAGLAQLLPTVGQQLIDPLGRMGADAIQRIAEVSLRVDPQSGPIGPSPDLHDVDLAPASLPDGERRARRSGSLTLSARPRMQTRQRVSAATNGPGEVRPGGPGDGPEAAPARRAGRRTGRAHDAGSSIPG